MNGTTVVTRTIHMVFNGFCLNCGRKTERAHYTEDCDMAGAEERTALLDLALRYWVELRKRDREASDDG